MSLLDLEMSIAYNLQSKSTKDLGCEFLEHNFTHLQSVERQVAHGTSSGSPYISVVYEQKWLKFGVQAHFLKMFGHAKFQLSISCTFKAIQLLVMY